MSEDRTHDHWATPKWLYDKLDKEFNFDFDPCPLHSKFDGLSVEWGESNFINPPYNRKDKPKFIKKAYEQWMKGKTCVLLIPVKTSTADFHNILLPHAEIRYLRGRPKFLEHGEEGSQSGRNDIMICVLSAQKDSREKNVIVKSEVKE